MEKVEGPHARAVLIGFIMIVVAWLAIPYGDYVLGNNAAIAYLLSSALIWVLFWETRNHHSDTRTGWVPYARGAATMWVGTAAVVGAAALGSALRPAGDSSQEAVDSFLREIGVLGFSISMVLVGVVVMFRALILILTSTFAEDSEDDVYVSELR